MVAAEPKTVDADIVATNTEQTPSHPALQLPTLEDVVDEWLAGLDVRPQSRATYRRQLKPFINWLQEEQLVGAFWGNTLKRADLNRYKQHLLDELKPRTVAGYLTPLRNLFGWLERETGGEYRNPASQLKNPKVDGHARDALTAEQARRLLDAIERDGLKGLRDYAMVNLMLRTGLRRIELERADVGDLRQEQGHPVLYIQGKGKDGKGDYVVLSDEALQPIREWLTARREQLGATDDDSPLFVSTGYRARGERLTGRSISRVAKGALKDAGLADSRLTAHSLRHTAITLAIEGGASLEQAQAMARHADPKTTKQYFHNRERVESAAEKCIDF